MDKSNITLAGAIRKGMALLKENGIENADIDSFELMAGINGMDRTYYFMHGQDILEQSVYERFLENIRKRARHIPLQHILGKAFFYGYEFKVNEAVLVPRPDTEILVEQALGVVSDESTVIDMCTGSGCILITLALQKHIKKGIAADISEKALEVAKYNADNLKAENIEFVQGNLFEALDKNKAGKPVCDSADIIVSNPPYIPTDVISTLSEEVRVHDPYIALDGKEDGLYFYREITKNSVKYLKKDGWLMYEIGYDQAAAVTDILKAAQFTDIKTVKDLAGLDRVVRARKL